MSAAAELQKAIIDALVADAAVGALVGDRIYDRMPQDGDYPCITFGPSQQLTADEEQIDLEDHSVQLDCWSRDHGRKKPVMDIMAAVKTALHDASLSLPDPYALVFIRVRDMRPFLDRDGITAHGVVDIEAAVEL